MKNKQAIIIAVTIIAVAAIGALAWKGSDQGPGQYDDFARCLTEKGTKMYGAYWCSHCKNQKELFGASWQYIDYIECAIPNQQTQTGVCQNANIKSYPTWEFAGGARISGELTIDQLSQQSGCPVNPTTEGTS